MTSPGVVPRPVQPVAAMRAMRRLLDDPDDTAQVFHIIRALTGRSFENLYQRVMADPDGRRILDEKRDILSVLTDRDRLRGLPEGTLGREYARFLDVERISAEGLVEASDDDPDDAHFLDERARVLSRRLRDTHDLWHVVTGYQRDLLGEAALLAFTYAQTGNHGIGFIVVIGTLRLWREGYGDVVALVHRAWRRGRRAASFVAADWESLLSIPLVEVRSRLGVDEPPAYTPTFSVAAPAH
jgi:ubiquinone biosynthesis protein COQ4